MGSLIWGLLSKFQERSAKQNETGLLSCRAHREVVFVVAVAHLARESIAGPSVLLNVKTSLAVIYGASRR